MSSGATTPTNVILGLVPRTHFSTCWDRESAIQFLSAPDATALGADPCGHVIGDPACRAMDPRNKSEDDTGLFGLGRWNNRWNSV